jgi:hypothetical protein
VRGTPSGRGSDAAACVNDSFCRSLQSVALRWSPRWLGTTPFALGGGSVSAAAEQLHPHLDPQRTQGALRVTRKLPSAPDIRADEGRTPCRRNVGDVTLQLRDYPRGHQGGAHEPSHCIVGRGRCLDCYFNCRRSCAWLRARHVLQRATLRAAGRRRLSSTPPSLR